MAQSKRHHYVPQSVLRRFSIDGLGTHVHVLDKDRNETRRESISSTGMENHFNTVVVDGARENFEDLFNDTDGALAGAHKRLVEARSLKNMSAEDRAALDDGMAVQLIRTKLYRSTIAQTTEAIMKNFAELGLADPEAPGLDEQAVRASARDSLLRRESIREGFSSKALLLIEAEPGESFWISDQPVVTYNTLPYGELGLGDEGVEIYFPVSPDLALAFWCPSIMRKVADAVALGDRLPEPLRSQCAEIQAAYTDGRPTTLHRQGVAKFLNELQVRAAYRFVYAAKPDFDFAEEVLARAPQSRAPRSTITVGRVGQGVPSMTRMPAGRHLVVYHARGSTMLPVSEVGEAGLFGMIVTTPEAPLAAALLADQPWSRVTLFEDQQPMREMRQIKVVGEPHGSSFRLTIQNSL